MILFYLAAKMELLHVVPLCVFLVLVSQCQAEIPEVQLDPESARHGKSKYKETFV